MRRSFIAVLGALSLTVAAVVAYPTSASAEPGDLDGTFGGCGLALTGTPFLRSISTADGDKILELTAGQPSIQATKIAITRRDADGHVDRSFGTRGRTTVVIPGYVDPQYLVQIVVDHSHRVLASITADINPSEVDTRGFVIRLTAAGALDPTFGGGIVRTALQQVEFVVGSGDDLYGVGGGSPTDAISVPIHVDAMGSIDNSFVLESLPGATGVRHVSLQAVQTNGMLLGTDATAQTTIARWQPDGTLDAGFTTITPPVLGRTSVGPYDVADAPDGKIVVLYFIATAPNRTPQALVARYLANGIPDPSFGLLGAVVVPTTATQHALSIDSTGRIMVSSQAVLGSRHPPRILRLLPNGALDPQFGASGVTTLDTEGLFSTARHTQAWNLSTAILVSGSNTAVRYVSARVSMVPLRQGAGLVLQWDGTAWPTRWGTDPGPECPFDTPYWPDNDNARGITTVAGQGGYEVDLFGGIHPFSIGRQRPRPAAAVGAAYWPGWDIVRGIAAKPDGTGGYTLDAFGGIHPFHTGTAPQPPPAFGNPYWPGSDITRGIALMPDGNRGYVLDLFGGIHRFTTPGHRLPPRVVGAPYWPGFDIARGISILDDGTGGYTVDGYGGIHPFALGNHAAPPPPTPSQAVPYLPGVDWVRGFAFIPPKTATVASAGSLRGATGSTAATTTLDALLTRTRHTPGQTPGRRAAP